MQHGGSIPGKSPESGVCLPRGGRAGRPGCEERELRDYEGVRSEPWKGPPVQGPAGMARRSHLLPEGVEQGSFVFMGSHRLRSPKGWGQCRRPA